jgi:hypothetical protein
LKKSVLFLVALLVSITTGTFLVGFGVLAAKPGHLMVSRARIHTVVSSTETYYGLQLTPEDAANAKVTEQQAVAEALHYSFGTQGSDGSVAPGVTVNAEYGLFTDTQMTTEDAGGQQVPQYQAVPAWVITFLGQGVGGGPSSGPIGVRRRPSPVRHATGIPNQTVVIDANTGAFIETVN